MPSVLTTTVLLLLFILTASGQTCSYSVAGFTTNSEIKAPLDTITFDNIGLSGPWVVSQSPLRVTPATSMDVTATGTPLDFFNQVRVRTGVIYLSGDLKTSWTKEDYFFAFDSFFHNASLTFANPIRQFSLQIAQDTGCIPTGNIPKLTLKDSSGAALACLNLNMAPPPTSADQIGYLQYKGTTANIKELFFTGCLVAFDNLKYKIDPCSPTPCDPIGERCYDLGQDAICCSKKNYWDGAACIDTCAALSPCDTNAVCTNLRFQAGGYTCQCRPEYFGDGSPGNCTALDPAPNTKPLDIVPILECIDEKGFAQFGYESNENTTLLIVDALRNNFAPFNVNPVAVFRPGRSVPYPLNVAELPLNITADQYLWVLESYRLEFSNTPARACPTQISVIFTFRITGAVNITAFAELTRETFIQVTGVPEDRVILANFTELSRPTKRSAVQLDPTELEVELSVMPPAPNSTEKSAAEIIRDFVEDQQPDFEHDLQEATPDTTIEVIVGAKEGNATLRGFIPMPVAAPISEPLTSNPPITAPVTINPPMTTPQAVPVQVSTPINLVTSSGRIFEWKFVVCMALWVFGLSKGEMHKSKRETIKRYFSNMLPQASILISIILVISVGHGQMCTPVFDVGVEISSPLETRLPSIIWALLCHGIA